MIRTLSIVLLSTILLMSTSASAVYPAELKGLWRVAAVHIDKRLTRAQSYEFDDKRLMRRTIDFRTASVRSNVPEGIECRNPILMRLAIAPENLISVVTPVRNMPATHPTVNDYGLANSYFRSGIAYSLKCRLGALGPAVDKLSTGTAEVNWVVVQTDGRLAIHWYDETILVMEPAR